MKLDVNNVFLILNVVAWILTFSMYRKKTLFFGAASVIILSYLLYSIISLLLYNDSFWGTEFSQLHLFPFIYLYLMLMLVTYPVFKFDRIKNLEIQKPSNLIFNSISLVLIVSTFLMLPERMISISNNFMSILFKSAGLNIYNETMQDSLNMKIGDGRISNLPAIISGLLTDIGSLMFFYSLTLKKRNKFITIGLLIAIIFPILDSVAMSQRGPVATHIVTLIISYFAVKRLIPGNTNNVIKTVGIIFVIVIMIPIIAITISRFDRKGSGGSESSILYYTGQQNLYFNMYGLDNGGIRYGDRTFPMFKRMLGFENVPHNFYERRAKYRNLKINDEVFIGFVGDFTLDYGPFIAPLIFIFFTFYILRLTRVRNSRILFHQLVLIHFVMCICIQGGMKLFSYADVSNLRIITIFIAYIAFRYDYGQIIRKRVMNQLEASSKLY
jgi:oligosaccharide repeat unit polymerase